jgi:hypothetical protein
MGIFYIQFEVVPLPRSPDYEKSGGAYVNCWLKAETDTNATTLASAAIHEAGWNIVAVEEERQEVNEAHYLDNKEGREHFEQARIGGECYVFHPWPIDDHEGQDVH